MPTRYLTMKPFVLVILFALIAPAQAQEPGENRPEDPDLRILAYNVWYGFTKVPDRKPLWLDWMKAQEADVVFLQELNEYTPQMLEDDAAVWGAYPHATQTSWYTAIYLMVLSFLKELVLTPACPCGCAKIQVWRNY